jgi:hypothetical protein
MDNSRIVGQQPSYLITLSLQLSPTIRQRTISLGNKAETLLLWGRVDLVVANDNVLLVRRTCIMAQLSEYNWIIYVSPVRSLQDDRGRTNINSHGFEGLQLLPKQLHHGKKEQSKI